MSSNVSVVSSRDTTITGFVRGQERFGFLYALTLAVVVGCAMTFRLVHRVGWTETVLVLIGGLFLVWGVLFTILEMRRLAQTTQERAEDIVAEKKETYGPVTVQPPTGEPYPHHEDYPESAGFDQGQLTSRIPGSTPFIEDLASQQEEVTR
jgi:hypothetical protein